MKVENIRIAKSAMSDTIYAGEVSSDGRSFKGSKKDVTSDFYKCIIETFAGYEADIVGGDGKKYLISVKEVSE